MSRHQPHQDCWPRHYMHSGLHCEKLSVQVHWQQSRHRRRLKVLQQIRGLVV